MLAGIERVGVRPSCDAGSPSSHASRSGYSRLDYDAGGAGPSGSRSAGIEDLIHPWLTREVLPEPSPAGESRTALSAHMGMSFCSSLLFLVLWWSLFFVSSVLL